MADLMLTTHDILKKIDDITYSLTYAKQAGADDMTLSVCIVIEMKNDNSQAYLQAIRDTHDKISDIGFKDITLTTAIGRANLLGYIHVI